MGRLFDRRVRWGPTRLGWIVGFGFAVICVAGALQCAHPFLALDRPVGAEVLVIEGWLPEYALRQCVPIIRRGTYKQIITVGGPATGYPPPVKDDDTLAYVAMMTLRRAGVDPKSIQMVPTKSASRDRTFHFASDLRRWLNSREVPAKSVDVVTLGVHARRSRLLFEKALGPEVRVGVIALLNEEYDPSRWWRYSEGVKELIAESAGYLYARFFFRPSRPEENSLPLSH